MFVHVLTVNCHINLNFQKAQKSISVTTKKISLQQFGCRDIKCSTFTLQNHVYYEDIKSSRFVTKTLLFPFFYGTKAFLKSNFSQAHTSSNFLNNKNYRHQVLSTIWYVHIFKPHAQLTFSFNEKRIFSSFKCQCLYLVKHISRKCGLE